MSFINTFLGAPKVMSVGNANNIKLTELTLISFSCCLVLKNPGQNLLKKLNFVSILIELVVSVFNDQNFLIFTKLLEVILPSDILKEDF